MSRDCPPSKWNSHAKSYRARASNVGVLTNLQDPKAPPQAQELEAAARALQVKIVPSDVSRPDEIESALEVLASRRVDVVIVLQTSMLVGKTRQIAEAALAKRLPTVYGYRDHVIAGGLVSYGVDLRWCFHRAAYFVDKILRGAAPGDLPVEFPTKMVLAVNLKTAKVLGLDVPPTLLARADEVIE
jgi:putative ABC transport system substrate-binding protein